MSNTSEIYDNLIKAYPSDYFVVYKFTAPGGASHYSGTQLFDLKVSDGDWVQAYKLNASSGPSLTAEEVKQKAFPFVYDTKGITDNGNRRDKLRDNLKSMFPNHNVTVFIFGHSWTRTGRSKGATSFKNEYGSDVDIILT